ncbi:MAG: zinc ribbon domain-containing protein [Candidatus Bathyarchaeota archaeon]|nr:zinc ribbon domain-containing protein [Candidatus Bathyarchaeota archaeon]
MPYCSNCGSQIAAGSKFCSNCGAQQQATSTPPQPYIAPAPQPYQPQGEPIHGYIQACKYGFPVNTFTLFLTNRRIVAVKTGGLGANLTAAGAASGGIVGGLIGAGIDARTTGGMNKKTQEYSQMTPDQMISKDKKNFEIPLPSIQSVEMKQPGFIGQGEIKFKASDKEYRFMLDVSKEIFAQYIPMLQGVLPGRVYVK